MPIDFDEIYPKIFVYKSRLEDVCKIQKLTEELHSIWESEGLTTPFWTKWYEFGEKVDTYCTFFAGSELFNTKKAELENLIDSVFDEFTSHYVDFFNINNDTMEKGLPIVCKYFPGHGSGPNNAMLYHTDFQQERKDARGEKPIITCNMYLNDDYSGGEVRYKIKEEDGFFEISYKPNAGEVMVFPSAEPY